MPVANRSDVVRWSQTLFAAGTAAGLSDEQLLDRLRSAPAQAAEAAFEALLKRHGGMVWSVCRNVLTDIHAAEDAFQAAFLVLLTRAGSIQKCGALGPWLYGVAYRVAVRAKQQAQRTRPLEAVAQQAADTGGPSSASEETALLHEEVSRLPEKYRTPIVLCYFEGRTNDDVAQQLGWPVGTVSGRLSRARALLRTRLTRRGVSPALAVGVLGGPTVPESLIQRTIALLGQRFQGVSGGMSAAGSIASLTQAAPRLWPVAKIKWIGAMLAVSLTMTMGSGQPRPAARAQADSLAQANAPSEKKPAAEPQPAPAEEPKADSPADPSRPTLLQWAQDEVAMLEAQVKARQAEVAKAEAQLELAKANLASARRLQEKRVISQDEVLTNETVAKVATAERERASAQLREAEIRLDQAKRMVGRPEMMRTWLNRSGAAGSMAPLERRMENLEQKLDQIIKLLSRPSDPPRR